MTIQDINGKPWAKLSEVKAGDVLYLDDGFTYHKEGPAVVHEDEHGELFVKCWPELGLPWYHLRRWFPKGERHYLVGQVDDGEHLVGMYVCP